MRSQIFLYSFLFPFSGVRVLSEIASKCLPASEIFGEIVFGEIGCPEYAKVGQLEFDLKRLVKFKVGELKFHIHSKKWRW